VQGTVKDPTGGVMQSVEVRITSPVSGFSRATTTDAAGKFAFRNLPPNSYHVSVNAQGFQQLERDVDVRTAVPIDVRSVACVGRRDDGRRGRGTYGGSGSNGTPPPHTDIDQTTVEKAPP